MLNQDVNQDANQDACARGARTPRAGAHRILSAIILTAACTGTLLASDQAAQGVMKRPEPMPVAIHAAGSTTATTTVTLSTLLFDFGDNLVGNKLSQTAVMVTNTGKATLNLAPALTGDKSYAIVAAKSCGATLAAGKSCDEIVTYLPTAAAYPKEQTATLNFHFANATAGTPGSISIQGTSAAIKTGYVQATGNPQVATYTMTLPFPGRIQVNFGLTTAYGLRTWWQNTDVNHGVISIFVAGMQQKKTYHMSATVELDNGIVWKDGDHSFKTGAVPQVLIFPVQITTGTGTPQPGIEFTNPLKALEAYDLQGNLIWTYAAPTPTQDYIDGAKMLPNGDILVVLAPLSNQSLIPTTPITTSQIDEIREINLAGETVRELSATDLNAALQYAPSSCKECWDAPGVPLTLQTFHHDIEPLPNGHWLILSNELRKLSKTTTPALNSPGSTEVLGDVVVDVDENLNPVWVWNEFNHLDPNRQPMGFPDWTHSNAVLYSPDDGNIIVSSRHQNWVMKVNYDNGRGDGSFVWKLGYGGDLKLVGGNSPVDWNYAQHEPNYFSTNTSGVFDLGLMDNGDDRLYPATQNCGPQANEKTSCLYTTIPVFRIDETKKTATLIFHHKIPAADYNNFGGNTEQLANGDVEYDLCGLPSTPKNPTASLVQEVKQDADATLVWQMYSPNGNFYRAFRIPSLYPGETW